MQFVYRENTFLLTAIPQRKRALYLAIRKMPKENKAGRKQTIFVKNVTGPSTKSAFKYFIQK